jgi:hypothetical protein
MVPFYLLDHDDPIPFDADQGAGKLQPAAY